MVSLDGGVEGVVYRNSVPTLEVDETAFVVSSANRHKSACGISDDDFQPGVLHQESLFLPCLKKLLWFLTTDFLWSWLFGSPVILQEFCIIPRG